MGNGLRPYWFVGAPAYLKSKELEIYTYTDSEYAPLTVARRGLHYYVQYYGCDIHSEDTLEEAMKYGEVYLFTPRNKYIAEHYPKK